MNIVALSDLRRINGEQVKSLIPITVTVEGVPQYVIDLPENVIVLSDLHPRVRTQLRAAEARARAGMPPAQKVYSEDVKAKANAEG